MIKFVGTKEDIIDEVNQLEENKLYSVEIKEPKSKRTLEQNKMLWALIHEIAQKTKQDDMDVYCAVLEKADAKSDYLYSPYEMKEELRKHFRGVRFIRYHEIDGRTMNVYKVYIGSSKMDTKEMTQLLDITIQTAAELGIPTLMF